MLSFFISSFLLTLVPGPGVIYTISTGVSYGKSKTLLAVIGCTLGVIPHMLLGVFGATLFTMLSLEILALIQCLGACYIFYLGYQFIKQKASLDISPTKCIKPNHIFVIQPVLINLLNPMLTVFFLSFLPQFVDGSQNPVSQSIRLCIVFLILTFLALLMYGLLSSYLNQLFVSHPKYIFNFQRLVGLFFVGYAVNVVIKVLFNLYTLNF